MPSLFKIPIQKLNGVGSRRAELFHKLGVDTVGTLLRFYPRAYEDWSHPYRIAEAPLDEMCCIKADIEGAYPPARIRGNMTVFKVDVCDGYDRMTVTFFNQKYTYDKLKNGGEFLF
ncbi:MAG: ATP-dependent DNA helicase RecG, partial [Acutalibacteraceae bacterium]